MNFRTLALVFIALNFGLWIGGCSADSHFSSLLNSNDEITEAERKQLNEDLPKLFKDPVAADQPTGRYKSYLNYLQEREAIKDKMVGASDSAIRALTSKLNRLDQDYRVLQGETIVLVDRVKEIGFRLYNNKKASEVIEKQRSDRYKEWQSQREDLGKMINSAESEQIKLQYAQKLQQLDSKFQIEFLGLLLQAL